MNKPYSSFSVQNKRWFYLLAFFIVLFGFCIRIWNLSAESYWIDEAYSIQLSRLNLTDIIQGTANDQHPFLYYFLLHFWLLIQNSLWNARFLSVLLGSLNILQIMILAYWMGGEKVALISGGIIAVSPFHVWYSQEVRMYTLLACLTTASMMALWKCIHKPSPSKWVLYAVFTLLSIYTHNFAAFILLAQGFIVILEFLRVKEWRLLAGWLISLVGLSLLYLPWSIVAINQFKYHTMDWISSPGVQDFVDTILRLLIGNPLPMVSKGVRWITTLSIILVLGWGIKKAMSKSGLLKHAIIFNFIWWSAPLLAIFGIALFYPIFQFKQTLIILAPVAILFGIAILNLPRFVGTGILIGILAINQVTSIYQETNLSKDDWRGVAQIIQEEYQKGDLIFSNPSASSMAISLYLDNLSFYSFDGYPPNYSIIRGGWSEGEIITSQIAQNILGERENYQRIWLVEFNPGLWDPENNLEQYLDHTYIKLFEKTLTRIHLSLYEKTQE